MLLKHEVAIGPLQLKPLTLAQAPAFFTNIEQQRSLYEDTIPFVSRTQTLGAVDLY